MSITPSDEQVLRGVVEAVESSIKQELDHRRPSNNVGDGGNFMHAFLAQSACKTSNVNRRGCQSLGLMIEDDLKTNVSRILEALGGFEGDRTCLLLRRFYVALDWSFEWPNVTVTCNFEQDAHRCDDSCVEYFDEDSSACSLDTFQSDNLQWCGVSAVYCAEYKAETSGSNQDVFVRGQHPNVDILAEG